MNKVYAFIPDAPIPEFEMHFCRTKKHPRLTTVVITSESKGYPLDRPIVKLSVTCHVNDRFTRIGGQKVALKRALQSSEFYTFVRQELGAELMVQPHKKRILRRIRTEFWKAFRESHQRQCQRWVPSC